MVQESNIAYEIFQTQFQVTMFPIKWKYENNHTKKLIEKTYKIILHNNQWTMCIMLSLI